MRFDSIFKKALGCFLGFLLLGCGALIAVGQTERPITLHIAKLADVPILHQGRVKPLDTFARLHLRLIHGKDALPGMTALEWLVELLFYPQKAYLRPVFIISTSHIIDILGLEKRDKYNYSFFELLPALRSHRDEIILLHEKEETSLSAEEKQLIELYASAMLYFETSRSLSMVLPYFEVSDKGLSKTLEVLQDKSLSYFDLSINPQFSKLIKQLDGKEEFGLTDSKKSNFFALVKQFTLIGQDKGFELFRVIPSSVHKSYNKDSTDNSKTGLIAPWQLFIVGHTLSASNKNSLNLWKQLAFAYRANDSENWDKSSKQLKVGEFGVGNLSTSALTLKLEVVYNKIKFFNKSLLLYAASLLLIIFSLFSSVIKRQESVPLSKADRIIPRTAFTLLMFSFCLHAMGIISRVYIMGRPPVATLYESILFVSCIVVFVSLLIEKKRCDRVGTFIGSLTGVFLLYMSRHYLMEGDTMGRLVAVLNTHFWLATHVIVISIGYSCSILVSLLAHSALIHRLIKPMHTKHQLIFNKFLMHLGLFALLFTLTGTALGGIWADQSWGRFWGWDPKENGALLIVLWFILLIHGRLAYFLNDFYFELTMALTSIIVAITWFGTNLIGVGLHSYGFTEGIFIKLLLFCGAEILFITLVFVKKVYCSLSDKRNRSW